MRTWRIDGDRAVPLRSPPRRHQRFDGKLELTSDSGGILETLKIRNSQGASTPLKLDLHPDRPIRRGLAPGPKYVPIANWLPDPSFSEMRALNGDPDLHAEGHEIKNASGKGTGVYVSGEIPRVHPFEKGLPGAVTWMLNEGEAEAEGAKAKGEEAMPVAGAEAADAKPRGGWCKDELLRDERFVAVDVKGHGLVLFSACSHAGICNVVSATPDIFNKRPVHMVVGGLHLIPIETQPVAETVEFLGKRMQPRPDWIVPLHCTGVEARGKLIDEFGKQCIPSGVGIKVTVQGDNDREKTLDNVDLEIK